jgi:hypothetical protein
MNHSGPRLRILAHALYFLSLILSFILVFILLHSTLLSAPPEGGLGSSWLKHALKQKPSATLVGVVRAVVVLVLERVFGRSGGGHHQGPRG